MEGFFNVLHPVALMLFVAGLFFILLGFISRLGGHGIIFELSPEQKKFAIPVGLFLLTVGLVIQFALPPSPKGILTSGITSATETNQKVSLTSENSPLPNEKEALTNETEDNFTNIRSSPSIEGEVVDSVKRGEVFYAIPAQGSDWLKVRKKVGKSGYMSSKKIKFQN